MNKIYRIIWSKSKKCYVVVSEIAKRSGKSSSSVARKLLVASILAGGIIVNGMGTAYADFEPHGEPGGQHHPVHATETDLTWLNALLNGGVTADSFANKANVDASNIGENNVLAWGESIGVGKIEAGDGRLVTGGTVYAALNKAGVHYFSYYSEGRGNWNNDGAKGEHSLAIGPDARAGTEGNNDSVSWTFANETHEETFANADRNTVAVGSKAIALGNGSVAMGYNAFAINAQGQASQDLGSVAVGSNVGATGSRSVAIGWGDPLLGVQAVGSNSTAIGSESVKASGLSAIAIGHQVATNGNSNYSVAMGHYVSVGKTTDAGSTVAIGDSINVNKGDQNQVIGSDRTVEGSQNTVIGSMPSGYDATEAQKRYITGNSNVVLGHWSSTWGANNAHAYGYHVDVKADNSIAIGSKISVEKGATNSIAIGARDSYDYAVGEKSINAIAIGNGALVDESIKNSIAIGTNAKLLEGGADSSVVIGHSSNTYASSSIALGHGANINHGDAVSSIAIGDEAAIQNQKGKYAIAIGRQAKASNESAIAVGQGSTASGEKSIAIGTGVSVSGNNSGAFGDPTTVSGANSYSIGNSNSIGAEKVFALGNNIKTVASNSVFLGDSAAYVASGTSTGGLVEVKNATVGGVTYGDFAGATPAGVVSVGAVGTERRLQNVAAGLVTKDSTDAINGSQLFAALNASEGSKIHYFAYDDFVVQHNHGNYENEGAVGHYSVAIGPDARAGTLGNNEQITYTLDEEKTVTAVEGDSHTTAIGHEAMAIGGDSVALGYKAYAVHPDPSGSYGKGSVAVGSRVEASDSHSVALGFHTKAHSQNSVAIGVDAITEGPNALSVGSSAKANGGYSIGIGYNGTAYGTSSVAIGQNAIAGIENANTDNVNQVAIGNGRKVTGSNSIGIGQIINSRIKDMSGKGSVAIGNEATTKEANQALAFGDWAEANKNDAIALGQRSVASAVKAIAIGHRANVTGENSIAIGIGQSKQVGNELVDFVAAEGKNAIAMGYLTTTGKADYAIAIGDESEASAASAVAIGDGSKVTKTNSVAVGAGNEISAEKVFALGNNIKTVASNSVFLGDSAAYVASGTSTGGLVEVKNATVGGVTYGDFAGATPAGVVSVGAVGTERRLQNVAAGLVSATSTDAINGSQLFAALNSAEGPEIHYFDYTSETGRPTGNTPGAYKYYENNNYDNDGALSNASLAIGQFSRAGSKVGEAETITRSVGLIDTVSITTDGSAAGRFTVAVGQNTTAIGEGSVAVGSGVHAMSATARMGHMLGAVARGTNAIATGENSLAIGYGNEVSSVYASEHGAVAIGTSSVRASNWGAIALGYHVSAAGEGAIAIGGSDKTENENTSALWTNASAAKSIAMGSYVNTGEDAAESVAIGYARNVTGVGNVAIGADERDQSNWKGRYEMSGEKSVAVGYRASTREADFAVALGNSAKGFANYSIAIGSEAQALNIESKDIDAINSIAIGKQTYVAGANSIAIGTEIGHELEYGPNPWPETVYTVAGEKAIAMGYKAKTGDADYAIAIGDESEASAGSAISIGDGSKVTGEKSIAIGYGNTVSGKSASVIGDPNDISGDNNIIHANNVNDGGLSNLVVVGHHDEGNSHTYLENSVALGANSYMTEIGGMPSIKINGTQYNFAGGNPAGTVSVGSEGQERTITNVAAGRISETSTDAINGSQLYYAIQALNEKVVVESGDDIIHVDVEVDPEDAPGAGTTGSGTTSDGNTGSGTSGSGATSGGEVEPTRTTTYIITADVPAGEGGMDFAGDDGKAIHKELSEQLDVVGGAEDKASEYNIYTYNDGDKLRINLAKDIKGVDTITVNKTVKVGDKTTIEGDKITIGDTTINNEGLTIKNGPSITKNGIDAGSKKITNVAPGTDDTDAVNVSQLREANQDVYNSINRLDNSTRKGIAGAAALAALHPLDFDPDDKWEFSAGVGNYRGETAAAVGAFYHPNDDTIFSVGGTFGNGENIVNGGVTFRFGQNNHQSRSKKAMAKEIVELRAEVAELKALVYNMASGKMPGLDLTRTEDFPDTPENHWAYDYVSVLAGNGVLEGYPDGYFKGDRTLTRYEMAAIIYRAMMKGVDVDERMAEEFAPELARVKVDTLTSHNDGTPSIQRVRVIKGRE